MSETADFSYDVSQPQVIGRCSYDTDGSKAMAQEVVPFSADMVITDNNDPTLVATHKALYDNSYYSEDGLHFAVLNDDVESEDITVVGLNWSGHFQNPLGSRELAHLAKGNPDQRFVVFDHLGAGDSPDMPRGLSKEIAKTGRFTDYGRIILNGLTEVLNDYDRVNFLGTSMGGLVALEMVAQAEDVLPNAITKPIDTVVVRDAPGSRAMGLREIIGNFVRKEGQKHAPAYLQAAKLDKQSIRAQKRVNRQFATDLVEAVISGKGVKGQYYDLPRGMFGGMLGATIADATPHINDAFVFVSPWESELNQPLDVANILKHTAENSDGWLPHRFEHVVFRGTHSYAQGTPAAAVALDRAALHGGLEIED